MKNHIFRPLCAVICAALLTGCSGAGGTGSGTAENADKKHTAKSAHHHSARPKNLRVFSGKSFIGYSYAFPARIMPFPALPRQFYKNNPRFLFSCGTNRKSPKPP